MSGPERGKKEKERRHRQGCGRGGWAALSKVSNFKDKVGRAGQVGAGPCWERGRCSLEKRSRLAGPSCTAAVTPRDTCLPSPERGAHITPMCIKSNSAGKKQSEGHKAVVNLEQEEGLACDLDTRSV